MEAPRREVGLWIRRKETIRKKSLARVSGGEKLSIGTDHYESKKKDGLGNTVLGRGN